MGKQIIKTNTIIAGCIAGVLCGLTLPVAVGFSVWIIVTPVLISALFVWSGAIPALIAAASTLGMAFWMGDVGFMAAVFAAACVPAFVTVWLMRRGTLFFRGMAWSIGVQLTMILLVIAAVWLNLRADIIDAFMVEVRKFIGEMPASMVNESLLQLGRYGFFGPDIGVDFRSSFLDVPDRIQLIEAFMDSIGTSLKFTLPARIICSSVVTGGVSYLWATWIAVRRGDDPRPSYSPVSEWRLPAHAIIGLPACMLLCMVLSNLGISGTDSMYLAFREMTYLAFMIQALGAISRRMKANGITRGKRFGLIAVSLVFGQFFLRWVGIYSALFGSKGLISMRVKKQTDDDDRGDD